jgi:oxygen-independent coproporphyrinogen-3 oxidase
METAETLGVYLSVPFCRAKCSFCNFASGVFAAERLDGYLDRLLAEMRGSRAWAERVGGRLPEVVDTVYFGGGTPSLLKPGQVARLFSGLRGEFFIATRAEISVECAPGQLTDQTLEAFQREGVNRLSFGVQSFVDRESAAVGRTHTGPACREELRRVAAAGIPHVGIDLIVGLPHQTEASWRYSVEEAIASGVEHVSVYLLEVDEDSRLGREAIAGGKRFGAAALPDEDATADWYGMAAEWLAAAGVAQYEISNFARRGGQSRHNRRYWERRPYVGFGLDAHSMLRAGAGLAADAVRWANGDEMDGYLRGLVGIGGAAEWERTLDVVSARAGFEEALFLGLRLVEGVDMAALAREFGAGLVTEVDDELEGLTGDGLLVREGDRVRLTARGREISNEVFGRLLVGETVEA